MSGDLGVLQRIRAQLDSLQSHDLRGSIDQIKNVFRREVTSVMRNCMESFIQQIQPQGIPHPFGGACLFAGETRDDKWILELKLTGADTEYQERGFHAIGSAYVHAQVAHSMLLHYDISTMSVDAGLDIAYRVIDTSIDCASGGIDRPVQLGVIRCGHPSEILTPEKIDGIRDTVGLWKQAEIETLQGILGRSGSSDWESAAGEGVDPDTA